MPSSGYAPKVSQRVHTEYVATNSKSFFRRKLPTASSVLKRLLGSDDDEEEGKNIYVDLGSLSSMCQCDLFDWTSPPRTCCTYTHIR